jgi:hypothetical protein
MKGKIKLGGGLVGSGVNTAKGSEETTKKSLTSLSKPSGIILRGSSQDLRGKKNSIAQDYRSLKEFYLQRVLRLCQGLLKFPEFDKLRQQIIKLQTAQTSNALSARYFDIKNEVEDSASQGGLEMNFEESANLDGTNGGRSLSVGNIINNYSKKYSDRLMKLELKLENIETLDGLSKIKNLLVLDLKMNKIIDVTGCLQSSGLQFVDLSHNKICRCSGVFGKSSRAETRG